MLFICQTERVNVTRLPSQPPVPPGDEGAGLLRSAVRRDIVDTLANLEPAVREDGLTAKELGELVGLHTTTVRFHLDQLVGAGILTSHFVRSSGAGRPSKRYAVAPGELEPTEDAEGYKVLAGLLAEMFVRSDGAPMTPEEAGAAWAHTHAPSLLHHSPSSEPARSPGVWLSKVGLMIDVLREWGYTPNLRTDSSGRTAEVTLESCPFLSLARTNPEVVCGVHRGLMRGTLEVFGETETELSLEPFVEPHRCLAHVTTRAPFSRSGGTA